MSNNTTHSLGSKALLALTFLVISISNASAQSSPEGLWRTIDDESGEARSLVRIQRAGSALVGTVETIIDPERRDATCELCEDDRQDQPIQGMQIIRAVNPVADDGVWRDGNILDPSKGKIYKLNMSLAEGGAKLEVRGFIGFSLLGRTQVWERVE